MQRLLAVLLVLIGLIGLSLGRLGETTWAPATETTATVDLADPGSAVVIDPGVLYVGGERGEVVIEGASDISVITAANGDIDAYLEDVRYTRITGASDWNTLSTQEVNPDGAQELSDPTGSDLWRSVDTQPSPYTLEVAEFWAAENGEENEQVYRSLLIVTDGTAPGAEEVSITWPVAAENEWVPFAYAGGAAIAVIGLVLLVVSLGGRRRDEVEDTEVEDTELEDASEETEGASGAAPTAGAAGLTATAADDSDGGTAADEPEPEPEPEHETEHGSATAEDPLLGAGEQDAREERVWSPGETPTEAESSAEEEPLEADEPLEGGAPPAEDDAPDGTERALDDDRTEQLRPVDEEDRR